jgi:hypothetical protein
MNFQALPKMEWPTSKDPQVWERVLNSLPEGSELIVDEYGQVIGVELHIVCMLDDDNQLDECDNRRID